MTANSHNHTILTVIIFSLNFTSFLTVTLNFISTHFSFLISLWKWLNSVAIDKKLVGLVGILLIRLSFTPVRSDEVVSETRENSLKQFNMGPWRRFLPNNNGLKIHFLRLSQPIGISCAQQHWQFDAVLKSYRELLLPTIPPHNYTAEISLSSKPTWLPLLINTKESFVVLFYNRSHMGTSKKALITWVS